MAITWDDDLGAEEVTSLVSMIYGVPGIGKTSLALSASKPLMLDFDGRSYRAKERIQQVPGKRIRDWDQIRSLDPSDFAAFDTVVVDTIGACIETLRRDIVKLNPKFRSAGDNLTQQGWGELKSRFKSWIDMIQAAGKDVIIVAHSTEERRGDETVLRIVAVGSSKQEVYQQADLIGLLSVDHQGQRVISFDPSTNTFGKNADIDDVVVPDPALLPDTMAQVLSEAKFNINAANRAAGAEKERVDALRERFVGLSPEPDVFGEELVKLQQNGASESDGYLLIDIAADKGMDFDYQSGQFQFKTAVTA